MKKLESNFNPKKKIKNKLIQKVRPKLNENVKLTCLASGKWDLNLNNVISTFNNDPSTQNFDLSF